MSKSEMELVSIISETLRETGFVATPGVRGKVAKAILLDLFDADNLENVQEYLNERIAESLPDRR